MIKIICDRCGAELDKDENDNELHFTKKRNTMYGYDKSINLCSDCLKKFEIFMGVIK